MSSLPSAATLIIRAATAADYEACLQIDHSASTDHVWQMAVDEGEGAMHISFRPSRLPRNSKILYPRSGDALIQSWQNHACFLVAEWDKAVIGYVNVREELAQEAAWVADLIVDRPHRLKGTGTALLRAAREWAIGQNLRRLIVETQSKNYPAIAFLQKRGLALCGYHDLYFPNQDIAIFFGQTLR